MQLAIIGSRDFHDYERLKRIMANIKTPISKIISGGARGADTLGKRYADEHKIPTMIFLADWETHGKAAGHIRNADIIKNADGVLAFWDGKSPGTKGAIDIATKLGKKVKIVYF